MQPTVLVVEDDEDGRELLGRALQRAGYRCLLATTVAEALEQLRTVESCEVVVTDIVLGSDDRAGLHLLGQLRARSIRVPVVLITASADMKKLGPTQGAAHLLEKPFRAAELVELLATLLALR